VSKSKVHMKRRLQLRKQAQKAAKPRQAKVEKEPERTWDADDVTLSRRI
jgi:hypothetical protein